MFGTDDKASSLQALAGALVPAAGTEATAGGARFASMDMQETDSEVACKKQSAYKMCSLYMQGCHIEAEMHKKRIL